MFGRNNALASYGRVANSETNPIQQIVMLYDGAIKFLRLTATDIEEGDLHAKAEHSNRALDIIGYLQSILDFERGGEVAVTLDNLYTSITLKIIRASAALDVAEMRHAAALLLPVRDAWAVNARADVNDQAPSLAPAGSLPLAAAASPTRQLAFS
jgi:flagellar secretion chaperone FliS